MATQACQGYDGWSWTAHCTYQRIIWWAISVRVLSHWWSTCGLRFAQQGIDALIPAEQEDDSSVSAHCAEMDLSESRSPLWGDRLKMDRLFVFI